MKGFSSAITALEDTLEAAANSLRLAQTFDEMAKALGLDPEHDFIDSDMAGVDFSNCDLSEFDFSGADLRDSWGVNVTPPTVAGLSGARLEGSLFAAILEKENLEEEVGRNTPNFDPKDPLGFIAWMYENSRPDAKRFKEAVLSILRVIRGDGPAAGAGDALYAARVFLDQGKHYEFTKFAFGVSGAAPAARMTACRLLTKVFVSRPGVLDLLERALLWDADIEIRIYLFRKVLLAAGGSPLFNMREILKHVDARVVRVEYFSRLIGSSEGTYDFLFARDSTGRSCVFFDPFSPISIDIWSTMREVFERRVFISSKVQELMKKTKETVSVDEISEGFESSPKLRRIADSLLIERFRSLKREKKVVFLFGRDVLADLGREIY